eukprot:snap_masked-scaffold_74-processed-gene-0.42-mRNA-1 protein AED:1.00 eAED:1.00 QI:0/0/0/0/1/1/2/0/82
MLKSLFTLNLRELKVENKEDSTVTYEVQLRRRRFEYPKNTMWSLNQLYENLVQMMCGFVEARLTDSSMKRNILVQMALWNEE